MGKNIKKIHELVRDGQIFDAQDKFREMLCRLPKNEVLSKTYLLKAYEINSSSRRPFQGLSPKQIEAHVLIVRQLLIENGEELDRRISRVL